MGQLNPRRLKFLKRVCLMSTDQKFGQSSVRLSCIAFLFANSLRFSGCYLPPAMVRTYNYDVSREEALNQCQQVIMRLGYEIEIIDAVDGHFLTRVRAIKRLFQPIEYVVFVSVEDRIDVIVYSEVRTFRRASQLGLSAGELVVQDASNNLGLRFQRAIFNPISREFAHNDIKLWNPDKQNPAYDREIRAYEQKRLKRLASIRKGKEAREKKAWQGMLAEYGLERDDARYDAVLDAEHQIVFYRDKDVRDWSLVEMNKVVAAQDELMKRAILDVMERYHDYKGVGRMDWIVAPTGRVIDSRVRLTTSFNTPEDELQRMMENQVRLWFFPPSARQQNYVHLTREVAFQGNRHNIRISLSRPRFVSMTDEFPIIHKELMRDTLFAEPSSSQN